MFNRKTVDSVDADIYDKSSYIHTNLFFVVLLWLCPQILCIHLI